MTSFVPITDSRTDSLTDSILGIKTYQNKSACKKCIDCFRINTVNCIHNTSIFAMICATGTYVVFGIKYIFNTKYTTSACDISHLWYYIFISTIYALIRNGCSFGIKYNKICTTSFCCIGSCLLMELTLSTWGFIEVYEIPSILSLNLTEINITINKTACDDIKYTDIWNFGVITLFTQYVFCILLLIRFSYVIYKYYRERG